MNLVSFSGFIYPFVDWLVIHMINMKKEIIYRLRVVERGGGSAKRGGGKSPG